MVLRCPLLKCSSIGMTSAGEGFSSVHFVDMSSAYRLEPMPMITRVIAMTGGFSLATRSCGLFCMSHNLPQFVGPASLVYLLLPGFTCSTARSSSETREKCTFNVTIIGVACGNSKLSSQPKWIRMRSRHLPKFLCIDPFAGRADEDELFQTRSKLWDRPEVLHGVAARGAY